MKPLRTPPKTQDNSNIEQTAPQQESSMVCQSCMTEVPNMKTIQCDICSKNFHFRCANVSYEMEGIPWSCNQCVNDGQHPPQSTIMAPKEPISKEMRKHLTRGATGGLRYQLCSSCNMMYIAKDDVMFVKKICSECEKIIDSNSKQCDPIRTILCIKCSKRFVPESREQSESQICNRCTSQDDLIMLNANHQTCIKCNLVFDAENVASADSRFCVNCLPVENSNSQQEPIAHTYSNNAEILNQQNSQYQPNLGRPRSKQGSTRSLRKQELLQLLDEETERKERLLKEYMERKRVILEDFNSDDEMEEIDEFDILQKTREWVTNQNWIQTSRPTLEVRNSEVTQPISRRSTQPIQSNGFVMPTGTQPTKNFSSGIGTIPKVVGQQTMRNDFVPTIPSRNTTMHANNKFRQSTSNQFGTNNRTSFMAGNHKFHPTLTNNFPTNHGIVNPVNQNNHSTNGLNMSMNQRYHQSMGNSYLNTNPTNMVTNPIPSSGNTRDSTRLTADQIAARKIIGKLPEFNGNPDAWPVFISKFDISTAMCGFSNLDNLLRLQESLQGFARKCVKSKLLIPDAVPEILETLTIFFGNPKKIINSQLKKVKDAPPLKVEKLDTIINYALDVQDLCATMEASGLQAELMNPSLLQEIVDKLPVQMKLDWVKFKRNVPTITLSVLGSWLFEFARDASELTGIMETSSGSQNPPKTEKKKQDTSFTKASGYLNAHAESSFSDKNSANASSQSSCCICGKNDCEEIANCKKFKTLNHSEKWIEIRKNRLCGKCFGKHKHYNCQNKIKCGINGCESFHHRLLHNDNKNPGKSEEKKPYQKRATSKPIVKISESTSNTHQGQNSSILFRIAPVILYQNNKETHTFAYLDEGSDMTLLEQEVADKLDLRGTSNGLCLRWTNNIVRHERDSEIVSLWISGTSKDSRKFKLTNVRTVSSLNLPSQTVSPQAIAEKYPYLKGIPIEAMDNVRPRIIIGLEHTKLTIPLRVKEGDWKQPIATKTRLGWIIHGPCDGKSKDPGNLYHHRYIERCSCQSEDDNKLHDMVKEYFSLENFGVSLTTTCLESKDMQRARQLLSSTTVRKSNYFETGLLWKYDEIQLPDSYSMALRRLECLERKESAILEFVDNRIKEFVEKGYVRKLTPNEAKLKTPRTWYLPIFTVIHPKKPTKIRLVWDAAAKVQGISLNSMLLTGPDQLSSLVDILRRFRERSIAVSGDIMEMFHQVVIQESDRHSQRFLWRGGNSKVDPEVYEMRVMTFGATCSPSSAQFVKNFNASEFAEKYPRAAAAITENHYVDDYLGSVDTIDEAIQLVKEIKFIHQQGGFQIRNFLSNSQEVLEAIGDRKEQESKNLNITSEIATERVLGMWWDTSCDCFTYSLKFTKWAEDLISKKKAPTKRQVLKLLMSVYDPLGLISHFLVYAKILLQDIWRSKLEWDEMLTNDLTSRWHRWVDVLPNVENVKIQRLYSSKMSPKQPKSIELHTFVDSSDNAYCAVSFLRVEDDEGVECTLVGAKTKVAPLKIMSIPRLELQGAVLGSRLAKSIGIGQSIKISRRFFWTDSRDVMCWLRSEQRNYRQFVAFRVGEIFESTDLKEWRWIPRRFNVADDGTKWPKTQPPSFDQNNQWFSGPEFLSKPEVEWPEDTSGSFTTTAELKVHFAHVHVRVDPPTNIVPERFSKWSKMMRAQAYVLKFISKLKSRRVNQPGISKYTFLSSDELAQAEIILYRRAQFDCFSDEINILESNKDQSKLNTNGASIEKSSSIYKCSPYLDDQGLLRINGRIDNVFGVNIDVKRPIILPTKHRITFLLIDFHHRKYLHKNHDTVINEIQQRFHIPKVRVALKRVRACCQECKNERAKPQIPEMGSLPKARLAHSTTVFAHTGIDFFGPMKVVVRRSTEKRWGVIFTCLTTRAIHIEIAPSLTTDSCILCIQNFTNLRGCPNEFYSDNGTNLKGAEKELRTELEQVDFEKLGSAFTTGVTKWKFNPPASPHMGGCWERMIRSVKNNLKEIQPTRTPREELLRSYLWEVQNIINSRPLTHVPIDPNSEEVLTPNHFLFGNSNGAKSLREFSPEECLRKSWKVAQQMTKEFWKKWILSYLPTLTRRTKWFHKVKPIEVGDVVIIVDESNYFNTWPKGIVVEVQAGKDGQVRHAVVRTAKGLRTRPAAKIAVLDVLQRNEEELVKVPGEPINLNEGENVTDGGSSTSPVSTCSKMSIRQLKPIQRIAPKRVIKK